MENREELSSDSIVKRNSQQAFSKIDNEIVMLNISEGEYLTLNEVASRIWELIENPIAVNLIVKELLKEYDIDESICQQDTLLCLRDFQDKGILISENDRESS